jgi:hypothetical protein
VIAQTPGEGSLPPHRNATEGNLEMSKFYTAGIVALFAAVSIAATTVPAAAKHHHKHHGHHHGHGHGHGHGGFDWGFGGVYLGGYDYDEPDPIYCVGKHGKLFICGWN